MQRLCPTHDRGEGLRSSPYNIIVGLLGGQRTTGSLSMEPHPPGAGILSFEPVLHDVSPHPSGCPELGNLFKEIQMRVKEEGKTGGKGINVQFLSVHDVLHIGYPVSQGESQFLDGGGAGLPDVVAADAYSIPQGNMLGAELDG